jgi:8-oxo-dGTP pyrophosphatase MutT (NUDIX family)
MGGTVALGETPETTWPRELWEEAGLHPTDLHALQHRGRIRVAHPVAHDNDDNGDGLSYSVEHLDCYLAQLAPSTLPHNQDGEVQRFELLPPQALAERMAKKAQQLRAERNEAAFQADPLTPFAKWLE